MRIANKKKEMLKQLYSKLALIHVHVNLTYIKVHVTDECIVKWDTYTCKHNMYMYIYMYMYTFTNAQSQIAFNTYIHVHNTNIQCICNLKSKNRPYGACNF